MRKMLIVILACISLDALSQPQLPPGVRGPESGSATRSVSTYLALERDLLDSLKDGNRDAVLQMLGDGFEVRSAVDVDETSAADWLQGEQRSPIKAASVRNLSAREFNDIAVVSFLLDSRRVVKGKIVTSTLYLIDIWRQTPHQLMARYVSKPSHTMPIPVRPTGRE
ncbi:hypothetical protein SAMN04515620_12373 [Collimonas sp. OK607]|uniref:nuclear transport factor 2 family protein n=1 Tax=Collimonas sp. OK607 TaxID=1798194 RepID=UPI0008EA082E|nr:nuclear transport factor 2 family protein [Collimonas sp. OK607]SFB18290.1 hypothetical protein SAMN04515620_12373 [Collimonas sp. OK607]